MKPNDHALRVKKWVIILRNMDDLIAKKQKNIACTSCGALIANRRQLSSWKHMSCSNTWGLLKTLAILASQIKKDEFRIEHKQKSLGLTCPSTAHAASWDRRDQLCRSLETWNWKLHQCLNACNENYCSIQHAAQMRTWQTKHATKVFSELVGNDDGCGSSSNIIGRSQTSANTTFWHCLQPANKHYGKMKNA